MLAVAIAAIVLAGGCVAGMAAMALAAIKRGDAVAAAKEETSEVRAILAVTSANAKRLEQLLHASEIRADALEGELHALDDEPYRAPGPATESRDRLLVAWRRTLGTVAPASSGDREPEPLPSIPATDTHAGTVHIDASDLSDDRPVSK